MDQIIIQNHRFSYIVNRKAIRSLRLRLTSRRSFTLSCPLLTPDFLVKKFITDHSSWILKNAPKIIPRRRPSTLTELSILDETYQLIIDKSLKSHFRIFHTEHKIYSNSLLHLKTGLKDLARSLISNQLSDFQQSIPFSYHRFTLRNQKTCFGSCSSLNNLNFNWQIIFFPLPQFRHLLLHEIAHLTHHNHSKNFYHLLSQYDPDYLTHRRWLKKEGSKCLIFHR